MRVVEQGFRGSQICRVLGSPIAFGLTTLLLERGPLSLTDLSRHSRRSKPATLYYLNRLRFAHIIRYESRRGETLYWIKYGDALRRLLESLDAYVVRAGSRLREET